MQQRQIIPCDNGTQEALWICISHKAFICENCRKDHANCKVLTIDEFHQKFSELLKQRSEQIDEVKKLQDVRTSLLSSPQKEIVQEMLKLMEMFKQDQDQIALKEKMSLSLKGFEQQKTKEKLKEMLRYIELKNGNLLLQNDFTDYYQSLKYKLTKYMNEIQDIFNGVKKIIQQQQDDYTESESDSDSSSSECNEKLQTIETQIKLPQKIINYESAYNFLVRQGDQQGDPTPTYLEEYQKIKFLMEIRDNYVIAASNFRVFLIQLQPPVVKSLFSIKNFNGDKITSISKFQNQDQFKFIIAQKNGRINIFNSNNDRLQQLNNIIISDQPGRLLIGLSENILVTVGGNKKIRYYLPEQGKFDGTREVGGKKFIKQPPKCLLVHNDNIKLIVVAGAQNLFIIRNQIELENLHTVDQRNNVRFLGYFENENEKKEFLFAVTHKKVFIYDLRNHNSRRYISFPHRISYFQVMNNKCLVNCRVEDEVNGFRAYQIPIGEEFEKIQRQDILNVRNKNIKLAKLQQINQNQVFQIFIVDNVAVRREGINI